MIILKDWIPGQITPPNRFALWRGPRQPGMTRHCSLGRLVLAASTINTTPRHHDTMSSRHHVIHGFIIAPIYYGGLICIDLPDRGLPAVILNLVRDDLRMMAPKPVAARNGAMKDYAECIGLTMRLSSNLCLVFPGWVVVSKRLDQGSSGSRRYTRII